MQAAWILTHALLCSPKFFSLLRPHTSTSARVLASKQALAHCTLATRIRGTCCASLTRCFCVSSQMRLGPLCGSTLTARNSPTGTVRMQWGPVILHFLWDFQGGGLWLEEAAAPVAAGNLVDAPAPLPDAPHTRGRVIDTNRRPCCFPASALHATMPWQGHRWLVTAYTWQHVPTLSASASALLRGWGFPLPQSLAVPEPLPSSAEASVVSAAAASGPRIFVDVCCGGSRPLCVAFEALRLPVLPVDLLQDSPLDILSDDVFDCLLRLCFSGQVGLMHASPPCKEYSRLKLRPGGPKAIRSPKFLGGLPSNTPEMQSRVLSSRTLLHRCVQLLECVRRWGTLRLGTANQCNELVGRLRASFSVARPRALHLHASLPLGVGHRQKLAVRFVLFSAAHSGRQMHTPSK